MEQRLRTAHDYEQTLVYGFIPVTCLTFGYDMLMMITATLSQKSYSLLYAGGSQNHPSP